MILRFKPDTNFLWNVSEILEIFAFLTTQTQAVWGLGCFLTSALLVRPVSLGGRPCLGKFAVVPYSGADM